MPSFLICIQDSVNCNPEEIVARNLELQLTDGSFASIGSETIVRRDESFEQKLLQRVSSKVNRKSVIPLSTYI